MAARKAGFHGDRRGLAILATILASGVALALFFVSFEGLSYVGELIGLGGASWLVPVALDALIIAATLLAIIRRAQKRRSALEWSIVYAATAGSSAANFASHAERAQGLLPSLVAASAPVLLLLLSHAIIRTLIESEPAPAKPKRTATTVSASAVTPSEPAPQTTPTPKAPAPRTPRVSSARKPAALPFDDVISSTEEGLLADLDRLGADPETSTKGSPESALLTVTVWALVERHGHSVTDLSRQIGHPNADRLKDRLRKARAQAPEPADALSV